MASDLAQTPYQGRITSISQAFPVSVSVSGWEKVIDLFSLIFPWCREHAKTMAHLKEEQLKAKIEKTRSESARGFAEARQMSAEADRIDAEIRQRREEAEWTNLKRRMRELRFLQEQNTLAENVFERLAEEIEIDEEEKRVHVQRLSEALGLLLTSGLEFRVEPPPEGRFLIDQEKFRPS